MLTNKWSVDEIMSSSNLNKALTLIGNTILRWLARITKYGFNRKKLKSRMYDEKNLFADAFYER